MRRTALLALACGCGSPDPVAFDVVGVVAAPRNGSVMALWQLPGSTQVFKFGDGSSLADRFEVAYETEPPAGALTSGLGVSAFVLLPGLAALPDGLLDPASLNTVGLTRQHAVIFKAPGATGPAWLANFADGFSCAQCIRTTTPHSFGPVDCTFVTIEPSTFDGCAWF